MFKLVCTYINIKCDNYSREETIQGRKLLNNRWFLLRQLFKGDNYSREETIRGNTVCRKRNEFFFRDIASIAYTDITT